MNISGAYIWCIYLVNISGEYIWWIISGTVVQSNLYTMCTTIIYCPQVKKKTGSRWKNWEQVKQNWEQVKKKMGAGEKKLGAGEKNWEQVKGRKVKSCPSQPPLLSTSQPLNLSFGGWFKIIDGLRTPRTPRIEKYFQSPSKHFHRRRCGLCF